MKLLAILLFTAIATGCQARSWQQNQSSYERNSGERNNWQANEQFAEQVSSIIAASQDNVLASINANQQWNNFAKANPEAVPFQQKIVQRLQDSPNSASNQKIQQNILNLALEKMNVCKNASTQLTIERSCLGRTTGQMMQLIAAIENVNRNHPSGASSNEQY